MKLLCFLTVLLVCTSVAYSQTNEQYSKSKPYDIKVSVKEVKNRTLECSVRNHKILVDQPKEFGADDKAPTPPEMLAISYGSCIASTIQFLAYLKKVKVEDIVVYVEGTIDFAKAMGLNDDIRAGFPELIAKISFKSEMSKIQKEKFIAEVFEKGAAIDNIKNKTQLKYEIIE